MEENIINRSKNKRTLISREELELLDKNNLVDKILQLEAHVYQLKNIIKKLDCPDDKKTTKSKKPTKPYDFSQCHKRHILLKFYYYGWNYHGYVEQEDSINTIEHYIFEALQRSCLIESRQVCNYHRCGRTDKGVSAFSQVISLDVRSKLTPETSDNVRDELQYCKMLNGILPSDIKCVAWAPVDDKCSARFDCKRRTYRYYFPRGNLNIEAMDKAAKYLIGHHDFRNLCKMDVANGVVNFERSVTDAQVIGSENGIEKPSAYDMCQLIIQSRAFLWHQIRCIMGILLLVGQEKEKPEIICDLFDVNVYPCKPQYNLAHSLPLNLFYCDYDDVEWFYDEEVTTTVIKTLQKDWAFNAIKAEMIKSMIDDLTTYVSSSDPLNHQSDCLIEGVQTKVYQPLFERLTCESLESRIKHFVKKRKIEVKADSIEKNIQS